ncbi:MAG: hypothetical protein ACOZIN_17165 [Myxococcota bacterium]
MSPLRVSLLVFCFASAAFAGDEDDAPPPGWVMPTKKQQACGMKCLSTAQSCQKRCGKDMTCMQGCGMAMETCADSCGVPKQPPEKKGDTAQGDEAGD